MSIGTKFIKSIQIEIELKAIEAILIKSIFIPTFNNRPITLNGIPYFISFIEIYSDNFGLFFPIKKPIIKKGIILMKRL